MFIKNNTLPVGSTLSQTTQNANLDNLAQRYAGAEAAIEATGNYYHIHDTLSEHLDVTVAHPKELNQIADTDKKADRVDGKRYPDTPDSELVQERRNRERIRDPSDMFETRIDWRGTHTRFRVSTATIVCLFR